MELEKDKWYNVTSGKTKIESGWYMKFSHIRNNTNYPAGYEFISPIIGYYKLKKEGIMSPPGDVIYTLIEDLTTIKHLFPENHIVHKEVKDINLITQDFLNGL